jgi:ADP-ribose pyrophosphatase
MKDNNAKPEAEKLGWRLLETQRPYESQMVQLREDRLEIPGTAEKRYAYLERGHAVVVVPVTNQGEVVLLWQYRYPVDQFCLEVPAGTARDVEGMPLDEVVAKELQEEIGATFEQLEAIGTFHSNNALSDEECHVFLATGVVMTQRPDPEPMEKIEMRLTPVRLALEKARSGQMKTGPSALALLMCEPRLRGHGFVA